MADFSLFEDLGAVWEGIETVRNRIKDRLDAFIVPPGAKWVEPTRANAVAHSDLLIPALERLGIMATAKLPYLGVLEHELETLYTKVLKAPVDSKVVFRNKQELKRMLGLVKRKAAKKELTKARFNTSRNIARSWISYTVYTSYY